MRVVRLLGARADALESLKKKGKGKGPFLGEREMEIEYQVRRSDCIFPCPLAQDIDPNAVGFFDWDVYSQVD